MQVGHADREDFSRLVRGDLSDTERRRIVRHLLAACDGCRQGLEQVCRDTGDLVHELERLAAPPRAYTYARAFESGEGPLAEHAFSLAAERERAPALLAHLEAFPSTERKAAVSRDPEFRSWALGELLIDVCQELCYSEAARAEELSDLAVSVAEELDVRRYGRPLVNDLRARAWGCLGEAVRIRADLHAAEEAFAVAESLVGEGSGDALEEARILELKSALRMDQRRPVEAHGLIDEAIAIYRRYRDLHLVGRAYLQKGRIYGSTQDATAAVRWLRKGLALIEPLRERQLELSARLSLMLYLHESGRQQEAWFMLEASREDFTAQGGLLLCLRLRWLEGKILAALHRAEPAEAALTEARQGFVEAGLGFDVALVSLDLVGLFVGQGRLAEIRRLFEEMLQIFQSHGVHREVIAALLVFQQALRREKLNASLLREIRIFLVEAQKDHSLRFEYHQP